MAFALVRLNVLWMLYAGIIFMEFFTISFFVTGYMYTEKKAGEKIKNSARGLFTFATYGAGMLDAVRGSPGLLLTVIKPEKPTTGYHIWIVPAFIAYLPYLYIFYYFLHVKKTINFHIGNYSFRSLRLIPRLLFHNVLHLSKGAFTLK